MASAFIPSKQEAGRSLSGLFYLILNRPEGLRLFDASPDGFWRSFGVFAWAWPVQCFLWTGIWRTLPDTKPQSAGEFFRFFFVSSSFDVAALVTPALLLLAASRLFGLSGKYSQLVVVNNWFALLSAYVGFFPATLRYLAPVSEAANAFISLAVYAAVIWLYYRVIRVCLGGDVMVPIFITLMMVMAGLIISELAFTALSG